MESRESMAEISVLLSPQPPLSSLDLMSNETRDIYLKYGVPLYQAALEGDWEAAKGTFELFPDAVRARITKGRETALHIAAAAKRTIFAKELVSKMTNEDLALQNRVGNTALSFAAASGKVELAKVMVDRNQRLTMIRGSEGMLPLYMAALLGHRDMVWYLYGVTTVSELTPDDLIGLLICMINTDLYDVALHMLTNHMKLAIARTGNNNETALHALARKPLKHSSSAAQTQKGFFWRTIAKFFFSGINVSYEKTSMDPQALKLVKCLWEEMILLQDLQISELIVVPWRVLFHASKLGNVDFIVALIRSYPDLIWKVDEKQRSIFHIAVLHRQRNIFKLIYEIGAIKDLIATYKDPSRNNMLHYAGMLPPPSRLNIVSGAALQMQRELLWFKEVEKVVQPLFAEAENSQGDTPRALFTKSHKDLRIEGEKWMKETATSCMVVATLIATVMFAAAFTLPGGNTDKGVPIYSKTLPFMLFAISDAIALLSSSTSILTFLSILTSRYAEEDFLESLPMKLIIGLAMLVISVAAMMVAFCATFFIVFYKGMKWVAIPIAAIACIPVFLFGLLQYRLFCDVIYSTYRTRILFNQNKQIMFREKIKLP